MKEERIQKILSDQGICSRRAAEKLISEGRVKCNGHVVQLGDKAVAGKDLLTVDDKRIATKKQVEYVYYMLHKPRGFVTTMGDAHSAKTIVDLISDIPTRVLPVGRLDKDSEGLLLLTNDGAFINLMTHPSHEVGKMYRVTVHPRAKESQLVKLSQGVTLDDGTTTLPALVRVAVDEPERTVLEVTLREGKNRQIRRMCDAVGLEVARLRRTQVGPVKLGMLAPGKTRQLTRAEVLALRNAAAKAGRQNTQKDEADQ